MSSRNNNNNSAGNNNSSTSASSNRKNWQEGLGGPVTVERPDYDRIVDPTLDACCQREQEGHARQSALRRTLQRHDAVAERERRRRHLVQTGAFAGCRCCYDPARDGGTGEEYRALAELRAERAAASKGEGGGAAEDPYSDSMEKADEKENKKKSDSAEEDSDDDDEFDYLLDEDAPGEPSQTLQLLEEQRRRELEWELLQREVWLQHGFGAHRQLHPARVLQAAGLATPTHANNNNNSTTRAEHPVPAAVLHLVDPDARASASLDLCLERLAARHPGTKFVRAAGRAALLLDADRAARAFRSPLRLHPGTDLPALVAIRDGVAVHICPRLRGLTEYHGGGGAGVNNSEAAAEVVDSAVEDWLHRSGVLLERPPSLEAVCRIRPEEEALMDCLMTTTKAPVESNEEPRFDCGVPHCCKSFPHEHVGEKTEQQDGLVVSEREIVGDGVAL